MPEAFCGLETVRKNAQWTLWALWEKKLPKNRVSRPIGVTSHITPLPTGEGKGEGPPCAPWEKKLPKDLLHDYFHLLEELERR